jgi:Na+-transporting NADH:ubiquinone oxidoreductase subunit A
MAKVIKIRRGLNIPLIGKAETVTGNAGPASVYALTPDDFKGLIPKMEVKEGDKVQAGSPLFHSKNDPRLVIPSPVSGEIAEVVRGEKRKILEVRILPDSTNAFLDFGAADPAQLSREQVIEKLLKSGLFSLIRQRPFGTIAKPEDHPKAIHISCFDTAPLAADVDFLVRGHEAEFNTGLAALGKLTTGKVHLNVDGSTTVEPVFAQAKGVQLNHFEGPHPAGNVGVQIHHVDPINKGEVVWYLYPQDVIAVGRLFAEGKVDLRRLVAVAGSEVSKPRYIHALPGMPMSSLVEGNLKGASEVRVISGNVLTGKSAGLQGFLGFYDSTVTVLPEGKHREMLGWLAPRLNKFSVNRSYFTWLFKKKEGYSLDTNTNGEHRAFVVSGEYDKVFPFDIYPVYLIKAMLANDIEAMERLGIYEVTEEDFALPEFVCTSKQELQALVRESLAELQKEIS